MLVSLKGRYLVKRSAVTLGRTTSTHGKVCCLYYLWSGRIGLRCTGTLRRGDAGRCRMPASVSLYNMQRPVAGGYERELTVLQHAQT